MGEDTWQRSSKTELELGRIVSRSEASTHEAPALTSTPCDTPDLAFFNWVISIEKKKKLV